MQLWWRNFLKLYLASTTDGLKKRELCSMESFEELRHWLAEEAEYQVQVSEIKHWFVQCWKCKRKELNQVLFRDPRRET